MTLTAKVIDRKGSIKSEQSLTQGLFPEKPNKAAVFEVVTQIRAARRQGTSKVKGISDVSGSGRKPFRQKGTGSARQGFKRSPLMVGGAITFGPTPRDYGFSINKKVRRLALASVIMDKIQGESFYVLDDTKVDAPKTKPFADLFAKIEAKSVLFVDAENENLEKSIRNIHGAKYVDVSKLNVYDLLKYEATVVSKQALEAIEKKVEK